MTKRKFCIEYSLNNASIPILWNYIGSAYGLSEWFADEVSSQGNIFTFKWNNTIQQATLLQSRPSQLVCFQWNEDKETEVYFEMKILTSDLHREIILQITDYAEPHDLEDAKLLWNQQVDNLKRISGM